MPKNTFFNTEEQNEKALLNELTNNIDSISFAGIIRTFELAVKYNRLDIIESTWGYLVETMSNDHAVACVLSGEAHIFADAVTRHHFEIADFFYNKANDRQQYELITWGPVVIYSICEMIRTKNTDGFLYIWDKLPDNFLSETYAFTAIHELDLAAKYKLPTVVMELFKTYSSEQQKQALELESVQQLPQDILRDLREIHVENFELPCMETSETKGRDFLRHSIS